MRLVDVDVIIKDLTAMKRVYDAIELDGMIKALKEAPTIEAEPVKHGEWENHSGYDDWYCSECGFEINYDGDYPTEYDNFKFCGCCGAKMSKE